MRDYDMSIHSNPDAQAWAKFFCETFPDCGLEEATMTGWFSNSMMAMHDHLTGRRATVMPDGSACIVDGVTP